MATVAPIISPFLAHHYLLPSTIPLSTLFAAKTAPFTPAILKSFVAKTSISSAMLCRVAVSSVKNTRITPIASYLAYKSSGYSETGPISGITISDFVSVWTPYNIGGPSGPTKKERPKKPGPKRAEETASIVKGVMAQDNKDGLTFGGTKRETGKVVMEKEGRESRHAEELQSDRTLYSNTDRRQTHETGRPFREEEKTLLPASRL